MHSGLWALPPSTPARRRHRSTPGARCDALRLGLAVEVVDLFAGEAEAVDLPTLGVGVVVVAQPADDVHVRALVQVLRRVLGLTGPQRPLDRGGLFAALITVNASRVADDGDGPLGDLAVAALDVFDLDRCGQAGVALFDSYESHDVLL